MTCREARACKEETKASQLLYHRLTAELANLVGLFIKEALNTFLMLHYVIYSLFEWAIEIRNNVIPN